MNTSPKKTAALFACFMIGTPLMAQDINADDFSVNFGISTLGLTLTPEFSVNDQVGIRLPLAYLTQSQDFEEDGTELTGTVQTGGFGVLADYYPLTDYGLRLSGGVVYPLYKVSGESDGTTAQVEGNTYNVKDLKASASSQSLAPYLGFGYQFKHNKQGWSGGLDVGALLGMSYKVDYSYGANNLTAPEKAALDSDLEKFAADMEKQLNDQLGIVPFISIHASYHF